MVQLPRIHLCIKNQYISFATMVLTLDYTNHVIGLTHLNLCIKWSGVDSLHHKHLCTI